MFSSLKKIWFHSIQKSLNTSESVYKYCVKWQKYIHNSEWSYNSLDFSFNKADLK